MLGQQSAPHTVIPRSEGSHCIESRAVKELAQ
jgi:hypothetical protein